MSEASRRWVKVWHEILTDQNFQNMSLDQQARFYNLLVYTSAHGDSGTIKIVSPGRVFVHLLQCENYDHLVQCITEIPNIGIVENDNAELSVTFFNWYKYQVDSTSYERVKRHRNKQVVTLQDKEKEEEKEKDKNKRFEELWTVYPSRREKKVGKAEAKEFFLSTKIKDEEVSLVLQAARNYAVSKTAVDGYAKDAIRFLRKDFWRDWIEPETLSAPKSSLDKTIDVLQKFVEEKENEQSAAKVIDALPSDFR